MLNLKKMGIKVIIGTVLFIFVAKQLPMDSYLRVALTVFGFGTGVILIFLDGYRYFDE